jgi:hypothetical protein
MENLSLDMLPPRAQALAELIGLAALLALVEWRGGVMLYIPQRMPQEHPIACLIGLQAATALADEYGGDAIEIPRCETTLRAVLHDTIRTRRRAGETEAQVARDVGMWGRSVRRICAAAEPVADDQPDLFEQ